MEVWGGSGISWTVCKQSAPRCRQITTPTPHHSMFTGRMLFLTPKQQCQSTEGFAVSKCMSFELYMYRIFLPFFSVFSLLLPFLYTRLNGTLSGTPGWAGTRTAKPIWILLKQETMSGSGISWAVCKSRQITTPAPHRSVFYRPDALPAAQPTASKHWRQSGMSFI